MDRIEELEKTLSNCYQRELHLLALILDSDYTPMDKHRDNLDRLREVRYQIWQLNHELHDLRRK